MSWRQIFSMEQEPPGQPFNQPVFITGCMRSGTSHLLGMLTRHPQLLQIGTEMNDVWTDIGGASCLAGCQYKTARDLDLSHAHDMTQYFSNYLARAKAFRRRVMRLRNVIENGRGRVNYDWGNLFPVNKSPHLINKIGYVHAMYPGSKWICIVRSVYAQSASCKVFFRKRLKEQSMRFFMPPNQHECWYSTRGDVLDVPDGSRDSLADFSTIPSMWLRLNSIMLRDVAALPSANCLIITFEDLVQRQQETIRSIFEFLDLEKAHVDEVDKISRRIYPQVNSPTPGDPLQKWRQTLTEEETAVIEEVVAAASEQYRYIQSHLEAQ